MLANLNAGIVSTIWAIGPLYSALVDFLFFKQKLFTSHLIGLVCLISCAMCISLASVVDSSPNSNEQPAQIEAWKPVVLAIITPFIFSASNFLNKFLTVNRGFDAFKFSFLSYALVGGILTVPLLMKLGTPDFDYQYMMIGGIGSIINTLGLVSISKACTVGPLGPVSALSNSSTVMFSIV